MKVLKVLAQLHRFANIFSVDPLKEIARSRTLYYLPATEVFPLSLPQEHIENFNPIIASRIPSIPIEVDNTKRIRTTSVLRLLLLSAITAPSKPAAAIMVLERNVSLA